VARKPATEAVFDGERPDTSVEGRHWIWLSAAPAWRLLLATVVGPRTASSALPLIQLTAALSVGVPGFFSDGFRSSPLIPVNSLGCGRGTAAGTCFWLGL
jgi:hypothetical protein